MTSDRDIAPNTAEEKPVEITEFTAPMFVTDARGRVVYLDLTALAFPDRPPEADADVDEPDHALNLQQSLARLRD